MDAVAMMTVQMANDVAPSGSPPSGIRMEKATAVPPRTPPTCRTFDRAMMAQRMLIQPMPPMCGGTLL